MKGNLFGGTIEQILAEAIVEAIKNPALFGNEKSSADLFSIKPQSDKKGGKIYTIFTNGIDKPDVDVIKQNDPSLISKTGVVYLRIPEAELQNPSSQGYQKLDNLCNMVTKFGKYGNVTINDVLSEINLVNDTAITKEKIDALAKDETAAWEDFVRNFDDPRIQSLLKSLHAYFPLSGLGQQISTKNLISVLKQDEKHIAAGKQPATYIANEKDWWTSFKRVLNTLNGNRPMPFYIIANNEKKPDNFPDYIIDKACHNLYGDRYDAIMQGRTPREHWNYLNTNKRMTDPKKALYWACVRLTNKGGGFHFNQWYDVQDTIPYDDYIKAQGGSSDFTDLFNAEDRIGFQDNLRYLPTEAALEDKANENGMTKEEFVEHMGGEDEQFTLALFNALKITNPTGQYDKIKTDSKGNIDMAFIKDAVFNMIVELAKTFFKGEYSNDKNIVPKCKMVACMYVCQHHVDILRALKEWRGLNPDEILAKGFEFTNIYSRVERKIKDIFKESGNNPLNLVKGQNAVSISESISNENNDNLKTVKARFAIYMQDLMKQLGILGENGENTPEEEAMINETAMRFNDLYTRINRK